MRALKVKIFRTGSGDKNTAHFDEFSIKEKPRMTILLLLDEIKEELDPNMYYESVCCSSICGSCAIKMNGQPKLACKTQTSSLPQEIILEPLDFFPKIKDLATDKSIFFDALNKELEAWIHPIKNFNGEDEKFSEAVSAKLYESERCIECGICISSCPAASYAGFISASGCAKGMRFALDPRNKDKKAVEKLISILASDEGLWGCRGIGACENFCPKEISLKNQLASSRRKILGLIIKEWIQKARL